jgi:hypothetical protein
MSIGAVSGDKIIISNVMDRIFDQAAEEQE